MTVLCFIFKTVQQFWMLNAGGTNLYNLPSYVNIASGQTFVPGMIIYGNLPSFVEISEIAC